MNTLVVAVVCAVIGAAGTVAGALIQARGHRTREDQPPAGGAAQQAGAPGGTGLAGNRDARPDDRQ
jgi:hypothetical protein